MSIVIILPEQSFASFFSKSETGRLFGGQYMYIIAELSDLRKQPLRISDDSIAASLKETFASELAYWKSFIKTHEGIVVWGAGAKGSTFLNLVDPERKYVPYVVDINPAKQNKYIARTGHIITSPEEMNNNLPQEILVMNENYLSEIKEMVNSQNIKFYSL